MRALLRRVERLFRGTISGRQLLDRLEAFPTVDLAAVTSNRPVLILAPHADDESLGCGGLIAEACSRGDRVHVVVLSDGTASHPGSANYPAAVLAAVRQREARDALACLGLAAEHVTFLGLPDGRLRHGVGARRIRRQLRRLGQRIGATTVLASWHLDPHPDHVATFRCGRWLADKLGATFYAYPVWTLMLDDEVKLPATRPTGVKLDIGPWLDAKRRAVMAHRSQTSNLITDASESFQLTSQQLEKFITRYERYIFIKS